MPDVFKVGEKVVYPTQGVGTVENISIRNFGSRFERFYLLRLTANSMTVMIPFSHVGQVGLRKVTRNGEVVRILGYLGERAVKQVPVRLNGRTQARIGGQQRAPWRLDGLEPVDDRTRPGQPEAVPVQNRNLH